MSVSLIGDKRGDQYRQEIEKYFGITMTALPQDWDEIEETIKATIKSTRAKAEFGADEGEGGGQDVNM